MFTFLTVCCWGWGWGWGRGWEGRPRTGSLREERGRMSLNKCVDRIRLKLSVLRIIFKLGYFIDVTFSLTA